jgi:hypothetical protein
MQREAGHLGAARLVRRDHAVGARALELLLGVLDCGAGDDRDVRAQLARGERREDVLGVGVHARDEPAGALDAGSAQQLVVGRLALEEAHADRVRQLAAVGIGVDDDVRGAGSAQVLGDLAPDAPEPTDDVVARERVDLLLHAALGEDLPEVAGDEELGDRDERVEERTDAEDDQRRLHELRRGVPGRRDRAHRGDRVERQDERVPGAVVGRQDEPGGARQQQRGDEQPELSEPARERHELPPAAQPRAHGREALEPLLVAGHRSG